MTINDNAPWQGQLFFGHWQSGQGPVLPVREPATGETLARIATATPADIDQAVDIARQAQTGWAATPFDQRARIMRRVAGLLEAAGDSLCHWNIRECGAIPAKAQWELHASVEQAHMAAALPMQAEGSLFPSALPGRSNSWRRLPLGVVGVIAPWNFPLLLGLRSVLPALALGNAVVLKPDPQSAVSGGLLLAEIFAEAGIPAGVFQVLPGGPEAGDALVRHPGVAMISFTGSTAVGRQIGALCGQLLKKAVLELGGNNPILVLEDADVAAATACAAWGSFLHQGQICMQTGRHLVHRSLAQAYGEQLAQRARQWVVGNPATAPVHLGPLINDRQAEKVAAIVAQSVAMGARVLAGGEREGRFFQATVLADVTPEMPAFREEIFGPVAPITTFESDEEALALANHGDYGLAAAIHSRDLARATRLAARLRAGMVHINDQTVNNEFQVPFGGMGASGNGGRFGGPVNLEEFTQTQWISILASPPAYPF